MRTPENARASSPNSVNFSHSARTEFVEVNTTHWYRPSTRPLTARSICAGVRGGSTATVGTRCGTAPCRRSRSSMPSADSRVCGISTRQPYSARDSHQDSRLALRDARADRDHQRAGHVPADPVESGQRAVDGPLRRQSRTGGHRRRRLCRQPRLREQRRRCLRGARRRPAAATCRGRRRAATSRRSTGRRPRCARSRRGCRSRTPPRPRTGRARRRTARNCATPPAAP